jgi:hypothetical protein
MALPELTLPPETPAFCAGGHAIEMGALYADIPMQTGHGRRRRVYTTVPRVVSVKLELTLAQALAFHEWFEGPLQAGAQEFSAQVANQGPGLLWWRARFTEPYTAEADEAGQSFWVTAKLLLAGTGSAIGPYTPDLQASALIALAGAAAVTSPIELGASVSIALLPAIYLSAHTVIALKAVQDGATPSAVDFDKRWSWLRFPYAAGPSADLSLDEATRRNSMGF